MARQLKGEKVAAMENAKQALQDLITCGTTIAASRAAVKAVIANDPEGERLLMILEKRLGLTLAPVEIVEAGRFGLGIVPAEMVKA